MFSTSPPNYFDIKVIYKDEESQVRLLVNNNIVGRCIFLNEGNIFNIFWISIDKAYQKLGLSTLLLYEAIKYFHQLGADKCMLDCRPELCQFYEKQGFQFSKMSNVGESTPLAKMIFDISDGHAFAQLEENAELIYGSHALYGLNKTVATDNKKNNLNDDMNKATKPTSHLLLDGRSYGSQDSQKIGYNIALSLFKQENKQENTRSEIPGRLTLEEIEESLFLPTQCNQTNRI